MTQESSVESHDSPRSPFLAEEWSQLTYASAAAAGTYYKSLTIETFCRLLRAMCHWGLRASGRSDTIRYSNCHFQSLETHRELIFGHVASSLIAN